MRNKKKKIILTLTTIFIFVFYLVFQNVYAADKDEKKTTEEKKKVACKSKYNNTQLIELYGITAEQEKVTSSSNGNKLKYTITMNPSDAATNTKISFTAKAETGSITGDNTTLTKSKSSKIIAESDYNGSLKVVFTASAAAGNEELELDDKDCEGSISITLDINVTTRGDASVTKHTVDGDDLEKYLKNEGGQTKYLDCDDSESVGDSVVNKLICSARAAKKVTIKSTDDYKNKYNKYNADKIDFTKENKFKCNVNNFKDATLLKDDESFYAENSKYLEAIKGDYYYQNRDYLYAWKEKTIVGGNYTFNYNPGTAATSYAPSCKVTCEEGVAVEYGPPIGSKAGLCFEYKVRVTSSVRCYMSEKPKAPPTEYTVCTPAPVCTGIGVSGNQYFSRNAGPNEDYDACIKSCDGGKYTSKCSKKCYKKVYGSSSTKTISNREDYSSIKLISQEQIEDRCINKGNPTGCYYKEGSTISWYPVNNSAGRWYSENNKEPGSNYGVFGDGFYRHLYANGDHCHDTCWWQIEKCEAASSDGNYYLNHNVGQYDYKHNEEVYKNLVKDCKAAASCSTSTAEFTIAVDYTDGNNKVKRINFPYDESSIETISKQGQSFDIKKSDKISSNGVTSNKSNTSSNKNTTIIGTPLGCYQAGSTDKGFYQVAWSFPGSWINNKTGEVSYVDKTGNGSWRSLPNKFCIPLDAQNVNQTWWNTYFGKKLTPTDGTSIGDPSAAIKCVQSAADGSIYKFHDELTTEEQKDIVYNINGKTKDFGYFGWNIGVSCFYALNTDTPVYDDSSEKSDPVPEECKASSESRVRTVDLTNLFPATDGSTKSSDTSATGRTPGFNWSTYATINESKNAGYTSYPAQYLAEVQKIGYNVYSDKYLDYEFQLDKSKLAELKKKTSALSDNRKYTSFNSSDDSAFRIGEKSGVSRYTSDIITSYASKAARSGANKSLDCNNVVNYGSKQCQKVGESS